MWKRVCEACYSVALDVLEDIYNSMPRRITNLIRKDGCNEILIYDEGIQCCCAVVFSLECI